MKQAFIFIAIGFGIFGLSLLKKSKNGELQDKKKAIQERFKAAKAKAQSKAKVAATATSGFADMDY